MAQDSGQHALAVIDDQIRKLTEARTLLVNAMESTLATAAPAAMRTRRGRGPNKAKPGLPANKRTDAPEDESTRMHV